MGKLAGKVALVTGAGRGIGLALIEQLAREGAKIVLNDLDAEPAQVAGDVAKNLGAEVVVVPGDVTTVDFPDRFVGAAMKSFGNIHIVVNNAGYVWNSLIETQSDEQWSAMQSVHLAAPFRLLRCLQPILKASATADRAAGIRVMRKIVNVTSVSGTGGAYGQVSYSAAKAGLIGLTKTLAKEWGGFDVNVNAVSFGLIETRLTEIASEVRSIDVGGRQFAVGLKPRVAELIRQQIALGRPGTPVEAAGAILLLCFPESDYISGQVLEVSGGLGS